MTVEQILKLTEAGYTKADIEALTAPKQAAAAPKAELKAPAAPEAPATLPEATTPEVKAPANFVLDQNQFREFLQTVRAGQAAIDVPPTVDINQKLAEHYTAIVTGQD